MSPEQNARIAAGGTVRCDTSLDKIRIVFALDNVRETAYDGGTALTLPAIAVMEVWWGLGYHTIFFLAGLASIPRDLPEAARIDGANEWQIFWHVIRPRLAPIMMILVVLRFGTAMAVIDEYLIFGGFNRASRTGSYRSRSRPRPRGSWSHGSRRR